MDGLNNTQQSQLVNSLDLASTSGAENKNISGELNGLKVSKTETEPTEGLKKSDSLHEVKSEPSKKPLYTRSAKQVDTEAVMSSKKEKIKSFGRKVINLVKGIFTKLKNFVTKSNFKEIPKDTLDLVPNNAKAKMESKIESFNEKLNNLNEIKEKNEENMKTIEKFQDIYGDTLDLMDNPSTLFQAEDSIKVKIPIGNDQFEEVTVSTSARGDNARRNDEINSNIIDKFTNSAEFQEYKQAIENSFECNDKIDSLSKELKADRDDMIEVFEDGIRSESENPEITQDEISDTSDKSSMGEAQLTNEQDSARINSQINETVQDIQINEQKLDNIKLELNKCYRALSYDDDPESSAKLPGLQAAKKELEEKLDEQYASVSKLNDMKQNIGATPSQIEGQKELGEKIQKANIELNKDLSEAENLRFEINKCAFALDQAININEIINLGNKQKELRNTLDTLEKKIESDVANLESLNTLKNNPAQTEIAPSENTATTETTAETKAETKASKTDDEKSKKLSKFKLAIGAARLF